MAQPIIVPDRQMRVESQSSLTANGQSFAMSLITWINKEYSCSDEGVFGDSIYRNNWFPGGAGSLLIL